MACQVVPTYLKIAPILSQTKSEYSILDQLLFEHYIKDWSHVRTCSSGSSHPQDSISFLRIKQICLLCDTSESKIETIDTQMVLFPEMHNIFHQEPLIHASFSILLIKCTFRSLKEGTAVINIVLVEIFSLTLSQIKILIHMFVATRTAVCSTWKCSDATACVNNE